MKNIKNTYNLKNEMRLKICYFSSVSSTNDVALENIENEEEFTIFLADNQTKGRGRNNREWYSPSNDNLYFSFILKPSLELKYFRLVPVLTGYSVMKTVEKFIKKGKIKLKWPNDVMVNGKKIAGILIEGKNKNLVVGIGINVNIERFPNFKDNIPTSIYIETKKFNDRLSILSSFFKIFKDNYSLFLKEKKIPEVILEEINEKLYLKNEFVQVDFKNETIKGRLKKVQEDGTLLVDNKKIFAGDVKKIRKEV